MVSGAPPLHSCRRFSSIAKENGSKGSDDTRPRKRRRFARSVYGRHTRTCPSSGPRKSTSAHSGTSLHLTGTAHLSNAHAPCPLDPPRDAIRVKHIDQRQGKGKDSEEVRAQADGQSAAVGQHASQRHTFRRQLAPASATVQRERWRREPGVHGGQGGGAYS